jgi:hypothetical protein
LRKHRVKRRSRERRRERYWQEKAEAHRMSLDACYCGPDWYCAGWIAEHILCPPENQGEL